MPYTNRKTKNHNMKKPITLFSALMVALAAIGQDVTVAGPGCNGGATTGTWQVPCNVTAITVQLYGGGGGAGGGGGGSDGGVFNTRGGGGGGGGAYSSITLSVAPGDVFNYTVGAGGCGGANGSDGERGDDGTAGTGSTFSGGNVSLTAGGGARGGSGSGSETDPGTGGAGGQASGGTTNDAGAAGSNGSGGNGGPGGAGAGPLGGAGGASTNNPGSTYGGGGAGGGNSDGGHGATGGLVIFYTDSFSTPVVTSTAATCSAPGTSSLSGYNPALTYVFDPSGPTVDTTGAISGLVTGTSYTVAATLGSCTTAVSAAFSNAAQLTAPEVPTLATLPATCSADGSSTISNYNAAYTYAFIPTGPTVGAGGSIAGMTAGTSYTVAANNGNCASTESSSFSNEAQLTGSICDTTSVGIGNISAQVQVSVYPNPTTSTATINFSNLDWSRGDAILQLHNNIGQTVYSTSIASYTATHGLNLSSYPSGVYTLSIKQGNTQVAQGRLVKE